MFLRLCGPPSIPLSFTLPAYSPGGALNAFAVPRKGHSPRTAGAHRLLRGLPGYLILFDTHAFVPQRQWGAGRPPSPPGFCVISMHFTATPRIPHASNTLKPSSFNGNFIVEQQTFTTDLKSHLRTL